MEAGLDLLGGSDESLSLSTVSKAESSSSEVSSTELDLGLGLSLCSGVNVKPKTPSYGRILTAKDFPSSIGTSSSSSSSSGAAAAAANNNIAPPSTPKSSVSGTKRAADSISTQAAAAVSQVVGWPPIRTYRINSLVNQNKNQSAEIEKSENKDFASKKSDERQNNNVQKKCQLGSSLFVKVNMDGVAIGRKVDLNAHVCYETLAQTLEDMFYSPTTPATTTTRTSNFISSIDEKEHGTDATKTSKLLGGSSEFVLTYEDKDGDWMLVGDVPWGMFLRTVKRLRIMRTSEANGLAPRFNGSNDRQRNRPI